MTPSRDPALGRVVPLLIRRQSRIHFLRRTQRGNQTHQEQYTDHRMGGNRARMDHERDLFRHQRHRYSECRSGNHPVYDHHLCSHDTASDQAAEVFQAEYDHAARTFQNSGQVQGQKGPGIPAEDAGRDERRLREVRRLPDGLLRAAAHPDADPVRSLSGYLPHPGLHHDHRRPDPHGCRGFLLCDLLHGFRHKA